jgi:hypothetical protein
MTTAPLDGCPIWPSPARLIGACQLHQNDREAAACHAVRHEQRCVEGGSTDLPRGERVPAAARARQPLSVNHQRQSCMLAL